MTGEFVLHNKKSDCPHNGEQLVISRCGCGARLGEDYYKFSHHLAEHSPEDFGLGGDRAR